uniref:Uncharacterized protein n=1 Tax=Proboscia inermis TaxID=420281 RepID=A0A7S0CG67_9STRA|mmetsp:Transcript_43075/g.43696  ORF Transcript_43075/g.43696 Transcript_43075/m.43696 type:complete len:151 (+) Transcript_43075:3-455(+)
MSLFFCHALPNATKTCKAIRAKMKSKYLNSRVNLDYSDLAFGAKKAGLVEIKSDKDMKEATRVIKYHQEKTLKLSSNDFKRQCPPVHILEKIWKVSLTSEMEFFPENVNGSNDLEGGFKKAAKTTLCKVNVNETLKEGEWRDFFNSYSRM